MRRNPMRRTSIVSCAQTAGIALARLGQIVAGVLGAAATLSSDAKFALQFVKAGTAIGHFAVDIMMRNTSAYANNHG